MTQKKRLAIVDDDGEHIMAVYVEPDAHGFEGADLSGLSAPLIQNLRGTNFRKASLYWANLQAADLSGCNFEGADLCGAALQDSKLVGANFRNAKLGFDGLGGCTHLEGADLTDAQLQGPTCVAPGTTRRPSFHLASIQGRQAASMQRKANKPLVPTRSGEAPLLAAQRRRWADST